LRRIRVRTPAVGLALVLFTVIFAVAGLFVWQGYRDALVRGEQRAAIAAHTIAAHFQWIIEASRQALRRTDDTLGFRPQIWNSDGTGDISDAVAGLPETVDVRVFDAAGEEVLTTRPQAGELSVGDRPYFQELKSGRRLIVSRLLVDRVTGDASFVVAQRLEREGGFAGIAAIVIPSSLISEFWASLELGTDSTASIIRDDGWLVTRHPPVPDAINVSDGPLLQRYVPKAPEGSFVSTGSVADTITRLVGYYRVPNAPLIAVASVSRATALAEFNSRLRKLAIGALPVLAALVGFAWWVARLLGTDERRRAELESANEQNRLLLREVHHRVKNNLQTVASLIRLQAIPPEARRDLSNRISAMAAVHEQIYRSNRFGDVALGDYLENIARDIAAGYGGQTEIEVRGDPVEVDPDRAMILGLIVTELVSNSIKHGFPRGRQGAISIALARGDDGAATLSVKDGGIGFDASQDTASLGMKLIRSFSEQLGGDYDLAGDGGLSYTLRFQAG